MAHSAEAAAMTVPSTATEVNTQVILAFNLRLMKTALHHCQSAISHTMKPETCSHSYECQTDR